jgi:hypothetical protein
MLPSGMHERFFFWIIVLCSLQMCAGTDCNIRSFITSFILRGEKLKGSERDVSENEREVLELSAQLAWDVCYPFWLYLRSIKVKRNRRLWTP